MSAIVTRVHLRSQLGGDMVERPAARRQNRTALHSPTSSAREALNAHDACDLVATPARLYMARGSDCGTKTERGRAHPEWHATRSGDARTPPNQRHTGHAACASELPFPNANTRHHMAKKPKCHVAVP